MPCPNFLAKSTLKYSRLAKISEQEKIRSQTNNLFATSWSTVLWLGLNLVLQYGLFSIMILCQIDTLKENNAIYFYCQIWVSVVLQPFELGTLIVPFWKALTFLKNGKKYKWLAVLLWCFMLPQSTATLFHKMGSLFCSSLYVIKQDWKPFQPSRRQDNSQNLALKTTGTLMEPKEILKNPKVP